MKKKKAFTLIELLAVIIILAIILIIAIPRITDTIEKSKKGAIESSAKLIARDVESKYATSFVTGNVMTSGSCMEGLNTNEYSSCTYEIDNSGKASVTLVGSGKFAGYTCTGDKNNVTCGDSEPLVCAHGYEYTYSINTNLSNEKKDECVATIKNKYIAVGWDNESAEADATLMCKNELIGWYAEEFDNPQEAFASWGVSLSDAIQTDIEYGTYTYDDIDDYFDVSVVGCIFNYLANDWLMKSGIRDDMYDDGDYSIRSITFHKSTSGFDNSGIDISQVHDGSILLYKTENGYDEENDTALYNVDIVSNEKIYFSLYSDHLFAKLKNLESINFNNSVDTSNVTNMEGMFYYTGENSTAFTLDVSNFDTSNVTNMAFMFYACPNLVSLDVSHFDTSNVTNMASMFAEAGYNSTTFTLDVSNFDTSNVTDMSYMFSYTGYYSTAFTLDVSHFDTSNVTKMYAMFSGAGGHSAAFILDVSNFDTSNVTDMSGMFERIGYYSTTLEIIGLENFDTSNVTNMSSMFQYAGYNSTNLNTSITILNPNVTYYTNMLSDVATKTGSQITVNYTAETESLVDAMIATKSGDSNVVKGSLITN